MSSIMVIALLPRESDIVQADDLVAWAKSRIEQRAARIHGRQHHVTSKLVLSQSRVLPNLLGIQIVKNAYAKGRSLLGAKIDSCGGDAEGG